jgi:hypothetical protein
MKNLLYLLLILSVTACKTTNIKDKEYRVSHATIELGSIGTVSSFNKIKFDYAARTFPLIENKIRLDVQVLPFNKDIYKIYVSKNSINQIPNAIQYVDSLPEKPKFVTISFMDYAGVMDELNAPHNRNVTTYLKDIEKAAIITSIAIVLPESDLAKLKQADAYYLVNEQTTKYSILLYKDGKKIDLLNLQSSTVLAYTVGRFCWAVNDRHNWYIGDIVNDDKACMGNTYKKIKDKEETNLYKL